MKKIFLLLFVMLCQKTIFSEILGLALSQEDAAYLITSSYDVTKELLLEAKSKKTEESQSASKIEQMVKDATQKIELITTHKIDQVTLTQQVEKIKSSAELVFKTISADEAIKTVAKHGHTDHITVTLLAELLAPSHVYEKSYDIVMYRKELVELLLNNPEILQKIECILKEIARMEKESSGILEKITPYLDTKVPFSSAVKDSFLQRKLGGQDGSLFNYIITNGLGPGLNQFIWVPAVSCATDYYIKLVMASQGGPKVDWSPATFIKNYSNNIIAMAAAPINLFDMRPRNDLKENDFPINNQLRVLQGQVKMTTGGVIPALSSSKIDVQTKIITGAFFLEKTFINTVRFGKALYLTYTETTQINKCLHYFSWLHKKLELTKKIKNIITDLYKKNNASKSLNALPEYILVHNFFNNAGENYHASSLSSFAAPVGLRKVASYVLPGMIGHFYFKKLKTSLPRIEFAVDRFIGLVDAACAKVALLKSSTPASPFTLPIINHGNQAVFAFEFNNAHHPKHTTMVHNSFALGGANLKNALLISPAGSGKTATLECILDCFYFSNLGITPAQNAAFTYCNDFLVMITPEYETGTGLSKHMTELNNFMKFKEQCEKTNNPCFVIFDEPFSGTIPADAIVRSNAKLPWFFQKSNVLSIVATHYPELTELTQSPENSATIWYIQVNEPLNGVFQPTYVLSFDPYGNDRNNWWFSDAQKRARYGEWLEAKLLAAIPN